MNSIISVCSVFLLFFFTSISAQPLMEMNAGEVQFPLKNKSAKWIGCNTSKLNTFSVVDFSLNYHHLNNKDTFIIHISANNRYQFYINGKFLCEGSQASSPLKWKYETINIAPFLVSGKNILLVRVIQFGSILPNNPSKTELAFFLQGYGKLEQIINTGVADWKYKKVEAYKPISYHYNLKKIIRNDYAVKHATDSIVMKLDDPDWKMGFKDDDNSFSPVLMDSLMNSCQINTSVCFTPRKIPLMKRFPSQDGILMRASGVFEGNNAKLPKFPIIIPPGKRITLLVDFKKMNVAYPAYTFSKGKSSKVKITYSEAPLTSNSFKGNRNEIRNKEFRGMHDVILPGGFTNHTVSTTDTRTFRYLFFEIETNNDSLIIECPQLYPYYSEITPQSTFSSSNDTLNRIYNTAVHTSKLCSQNEYWADAYYEHIQYLPFSRIHALADLYSTGNDSKYKLILEQFHTSRDSNALVPTTYPQTDSTTIPLFSLLWIDMLESYLYWRLDTVWLRQFEKGIIQSLEWHKKFLNSQGLLVLPQSENFIDFSDYHSFSPENNSTIISLHYAYSLKNASSVLMILGNSIKAKEYMLLSRKIALAVYNKCFDPEKGILANDEQKQRFSYHVNIMAVLSNAVPQAYYNELLAKVLHNKQLDEASIYYKFLLFEAMAKSGHGEVYTRELREWFSMLQEGMTTFAGKPVNPYADCQSYSASPAYHFFSIICGIKPVEYGYNKLMIKPALNGVKKIDAHFVHPKGAVDLKLSKKASLGLNGSIVIPAGVEAVLQYGNKEVKLHQGKNKIKIKQ